MSNGYTTTMLVDQRLAELRHEADQDRLAKLARHDRPRRRWWERLMLGRQTAPRSGGRPAATVAASSSPC